MADIRHMRTVGDGPEEPPEEQDGGDDLKGILEALLLVSGEPLTVETLAGICESSRAEVLATLSELQQEYREEERGIQIREVGGGYRMHTHPAYAEYVERLAMRGKRSRLTRAAVETLAIVAYLQPITRAQIAQLRGVQAESLIKSLEELGLVSEAGKESAPGGPALYGTSAEFLERFGLNSLDELPPLEEFAPDAETVERIKQSLSSAEIPPAPDVAEGIESLDEPVSDDDPGSESMEADLEEEPL